MENTPTTTDYGTTPVFGHPHEVILEVGTERVVLNPDQALDLGLWLADWANKARQIEVPQ